MMVGVFCQPQMYIFNEIVDGRNAKGQLWWGRQILKSVNGIFILTLTSRSPFSFACNSLNAI